MKLSFCLLALSALLGVTSAAHASPITYTVQDAFTQDGFAVTGLLTIDNVSGTITAGALVENGNVFYETFANNANTLITGFAEFAAQDGLPFYLYIDTTNPAAPQLCTMTSDPACTYTSEVQAFLTPNVPTNDFLVSGVLAPSPEPSSLILLGTGMLGAAAMARRRFAKA
jgi:hypothetical protein